MAEYYRFVVYVTDVKNRRVRSQEVWTFQVSPEPRVVGSPVVKGAGMPDDERLTWFRQWLFKKIPSPFPDLATGSFWEQLDQFSEEDKKHIQRMYLLEEM